MCVEIQMACDRTDIGPQGEVGVSYFPRPMREILPEGSLNLVDRMYQPGDLLKRSVDDVRAGVVVKCVPQSLSF